MKIVISGHRDVQDEDLRPILKESLRRLFLTGAKTLVQGMAQGTDLIAAEVALEEGFKVVCAIPYYGHEASRDDRKRYWRVLSHDNAYPYYVKRGPYDKGALFARNQWMVDQMEDEDIFIAVMSDEKSGTGHCLRKVPQGRKVYIYDPATKKWDKR